MNMHFTNKKRRGLLLQPLDVLSCRDGHSLATTNHARSGLPLPQVLAGAVRRLLLSASGCDYSRLRSAMRETSGDFKAAVVASGAAAWIAEVAFAGPWLARLTMEKLDVHLPMPATIHIAKDKYSKEVFLPKPENRPLPGWKPPVDEPQLKPLWLRSPERTERARGFLNITGLTQFLQGIRPDWEHLFLDSDRERSLFGLDERVGIGIDPNTLSAEESLIYASGFLALKPDVSLYAEVFLPEEAMADGIETVFGQEQVLSLGGEGRKVVMNMVQPVQWPSTAPVQGGTAKAMLLLNTPAFFGQGWKPDGLEGRVHGAAVPGNQPVSGWDLARNGPKPNRFAVPAGSVYFLGDNGENLPNALTDDEDDRLAGYGSYLKGVWTNE